MSQWADSATVASAPTLRSLAAIAPGSKRSGTGSTSARRLQRNGTGRSNPAIACQHCSDPAKSRALDKSTLGTSTPRLLFLRCRLLLFPCGFLFTGRRLPASHFLAPRLLLPDRCSLDSSRFLRTAARCGLRFIRPEHSSTFLDIRLSFTSKRPVPFRDAFVLRRESDGAHLFCIRAWNCH